jgi:hypothetical protein
MGFVGALVRANVTTKLWPSHPLVDRRTIHPVRTKTSIDGQKEGTYDRCAMLRLHFSQ